MPSRRSENRRPLTQKRIARAALDIVQESGYAAVSMRAVAQRLDTGQASLYAHVRGKADLDRVMIESVWAELDVPAEDPGANGWRSTPEPSRRSTPAIPAWPLQPSRRCPEASNWSTA